MIRTRKTYNSCSELPLYNFIKIVVHGDLNWLYAENKSALTSKADLQSIWERIFEEYTSISGNPRSAHLFSLVKEITVLGHKLNVINECLKFLSHSYDKRICDALVSMGFRYKFTPESLNDDLRRVVSSSKKYVLQKQEAEAEYSKIKGAESETTEEDFYGLIRQISRFNQFAIDPKTTSVMEFVKDIKAFNLENTPNGQRTVN